MKKTTLYALLNAGRCGGVALLYFCKKEYREKVVEESRYWEKCCKLPPFKRNFLRFSYLLAKCPEYRNLFRYRLRSYHKALDCLAAVLMLFLPKLSTLYLYCTEIGWNLFIQHGFATVIAAKSVGENCWINQQVTVGWSFDDEPPQIKNGVRICAGAKVVGKITVEDNAIIGANAVVTKDVGARQIVGGVPAKSIGENETHLLYLPPPARPRAILLTPLRIIEKSPFPGPFLFHRFLYGAL